MTGKQAVTVDDLLKMPLEELRNNSKIIQIVSVGKPRPSLNMISITVDEQNVVSQGFDASMYDSISWLTGCDKRNRLFCWPCLLFAEKSGEWNGTGVSDIMNLITGKSDHEGTLAHMEAVITLQIFRNKTGKSNNEIVKIENEGVNLEIKKCLIDVCCVAAEQQLPNKCFRTGNLLGVENCIKIMQFLRNYSFNKSLIDSAISLIKTSPDILNLVVSAVTKVALSVISEEMKLCNYVSIILSQHSDDWCNPQISTVLRYVKNGKVHERFVGFAYMNFSLTCDIVYKHISNVIEVFDIAGKICALSLDGAMLSTLDLDKFLESLETKLPQCYLVPWHSYSLDYSLQQCLSCISTCGQFIKTMASMQAYFQKYSDMFLDLVDECDVSIMLVSSSTNLFSDCTGSRFASSQFMLAVKTQRQSFIKIFQAIVRNSQIWDADNLTKAAGFQTFLQKFQTIFLLEVFSKIFDITSALSMPDGDENCTKKQKGTNEVVSKLIKLSASGFSDLWENIRKQIDDDPKLSKEWNKKAKHYLSQFNSITYKAMCDVKFRYNALDKMKLLCNLFSFDGNERHKEMKALLSLQVVQRKAYCEKQIHNELLVAKNHNPFLLKSIYDFYQFVSESNLCHTFKALTDLAELILTMPFKSPTVIKDLSKLQGIEKWSGNTECIKIKSYGDISVLRIESDIFESIKKLPTFHSEVMGYFQLI